MHGYGLIGIAPFMKLAAATRHEMIMSGRGGGGGKQLNAVQAQIERATRTPAQTFSSAGSKVGKKMAPWLRNTLIGGAGLGTGAALLYALSNKNKQEPQQQAMYQGNY